MGGTVYYAAEKVKDGYERADGKHFNMSYVPDKARFILFTHTGASLPGRS